MNIKYHFIFLLLLAGLVASGQRLDSLTAVLDTATNERKVKTLNELFRFHIPSDPVKALGYAREALSVATEVGDKKGVAASYNNLGVTYRNQGALDKALEYYVSSLNIYQQLGNKEGVATLKNNIANIYAMKKDYGQAMKYLEESYQLFLQLNDTNRIVGSMNNLGNLNLDLQLYEKAMKNYADAWEMAKRHGLRFADPLNNMGNIHFKQGNYKKAIENYEEALAIEKEDNSKLGIVNIITNIGIAYARVGQTEKATQYLQEATQLVNELEAYTYMPPILKYNAEVLYKQGQHKLAYETLTKYDSLREQIYGEESTRKIAQMEMVLDFQKKEKELEMLQKEDEIKTLQLRNIQLYVVLAILACFLVLGAFNIYFQSNKRRKRLVE